MRTILVILLLLPATVWGQTVIEGRVKAIDGSGVADAVVKATAKGRTLAFSATKADGRYMLSFEAKGEVLITFRHLTFETDTLTITADGQRHSEDMVLIPKARQMSEIHVKAKPVRMAGDTLKYTLAQFTGKNDVTLEDALRRLPGIEIEESGAISYMGQGISNFYVEGLDLLGGRYNLATRGMRADYAASVEVLTRHHDKKIDRDEESEKVALNIRLSRKAKFRPIGQSEAGIGWRESDPLFRLGLTGMLFNKDFQTLVSGKADNHADVAAEMLTDHGGGSVQSQATTAMPGFGSGQSPQGNSRYTRSAYGTANTLLRVDTTRQLRINANYIYRRHRSTMAQSSFYNLGDTVEVVDEESRPGTAIHAPSLDMRYIVDKSDVYVSNDLSLSAEFQSNECPVKISGEDIGQTREAETFRIKNGLMFIKRRGRSKFRIHSDISFTRTPSVAMRLGDISQRAQSTSLATMHRSMFTIPLGKGWRINLPVSLLADYDFIATNRMDESGRLGGWTVSPCLYPGTDWRSGDGKLFAEASLGVRWLSMCFESQANDKRAAFHHAFFEPSLHMRYTFSTLNEIHLRSAFNNRTGDILDLLTTPVSTSFRSETAASGIIGHSRTWQSSLNYKLNRPMQFFSASADVSYCQTWRNILPSAVVSDMHVSTASLTRSSHGQNLAASLSASKNVLPIYAKFSGTLSWAWNQSEQMNQGRHTRTAVHSLGARAGVQLTPLPWTEINYAFNISHSIASIPFSAISSPSKSTHLQHHATLSILPTAALSFGATMRHNKLTSTAQPRQHFTLLDCHAQLKLKRLVLRATLDNLLNTHHYTHTIFASPHQFTYTHTLCGRTAMLTATFTH